MEEEKKFKKKEFTEIKKEPGTIKVKYKGVSGVRGWPGIGRPEKGQKYEFPFDFGSRLVKLNPKYWEKE